MRYGLNYVLACCKLHRCRVLVEVNVLGSIGENPHIVKTIVRGGCYNYQVSSKKGKRNMRFLKKIKLWKKRNNNTPTKVDGCVCTEDPRTCDAATVSMDPTVMCAAYTQTETRMDGGAAAAKQEYEREIQVSNQKIRELEEELGVSNRLTSELMLNTKSVEQQVREYAEKPVISWSDDCECRQQISAVGNLLKKFIMTERDAKKSKSDAGDTKKLKPEAKDAKISKPEATSGRTNKVECETQTEANCGQKYCAEADERETLRRLEDKNRKLSELVKDYERKIALLNEEMEHTVQDRKSHIHHIKMRYEEENQRQLLKMRDMRGELLSNRERLPGIRMAAGLNG